MTRAPDPDSRRRRFEEVAALVYEPLQRYVRRRQSWPASDDVVSETLLVCWRRLDEVPAGGELPWCYAVARRCLANQRRSAGRHLRLVNRLAGERHDVVVAGPGDGERDPHLEAALRSLPPADREVVELWAWEGLEPREIALVIGATANAVSIRLHRVRQRLANDLAARKNTTPAGQEAVDHVIAEEER